MEKAHLKTGQKVFIQAGSGGVGTFAIQLAKHLGAFVATTTSTANAALVKSLGADLVVGYRQDDFEKVLRGYDVVLNSQDGKTLEKLLQVLQPGGKLMRPWPTWRAVAPKARSSSRCDSRSTGHGMATHA